MVTKSLMQTPFGTKFIIRVDGEYVWSEYISLRIFDAPLAQQAQSTSRRMLNAVSRFSEWVWRMPV